MACENESTKDQKLAIAALGGLLLAQQTPSARATEASVRPFDLHPLGHVMGLDVQGAKNEKVAKVDDLVINSTDGMLDFVVLSKGGVAGIGEVTRSTCCRGRTCSSPRPARTRSRCSRRA